MNNINVSVVGTANVTQMVAAFGKVQAQVTQLNAQLSQMVALTNGVDPRGYDRMTRAVDQNAKTFRSAAASTGMFNVETMRLNKSTDDYINKLQKQKMSFRDMRRDHKIAANAFRDHLAMQNMIVEGQDRLVNGKQPITAIYPREISSQLNTAGQRLMFFNEQLKSGAQHMVNWGKNTQWAGRQLMVGLTMPVMALGAAAGVMAYQVDKELTRIAKVYDTAAKGGVAREKELIAVRKQSMQTAIDSAKAYGSAGTDTLQVQAELAATGLKGAQLQDYTSEVMRISTLGELDHQEAIKTTISLQSVFRMSTQELTEAFNYMNAVENATSLATADFAAAIPIAAAPVKAFGGNIKELGILLTAMKERGIEATEGANAIKAAMSRLGRPSKKIQEEWTALTGTDIKEIFNDATSLIDLFTRIGDATEDLDNKGKIKAFSGLFGTYQVGRMMAMTEGTRDLSKGIGQVSAAAKIAGQDVASLAKIADQELAQQAESLSGQWDRAFNTLKLQLVEIGKPFLEVATVIVKVIAKMFAAFNEAPKTLKIVTAIVVTLGAMAGPVIMLAGLFANLFGNGLKIGAAFVGILAKLLGATKLQTSAQRASELWADRSTTAMNRQASAAEMLTLELMKLAEAKAMANGGTAGLQSFMSKNNPNLTNNRLAEFYLAQQVGTPMAMGSPHDQALVVNEKINRRIAGAAEQTKQATIETEKAQARANRHLKVAAGSSGIFAGAMALSMVASNETADSIAKYLMLGSMVVPAALALVEATKIAALWAKKHAIQAWSTAAANLAAARAGKGGLLGAGARGIGGAVMGFGRALGPVGLVLTAVTAVGIGIYKWRKHLEAVRAEQARVNQSVNTIADTWADSAGRSKRAWAEVAVEIGGALNRAKQIKLIEYYEKGEGKKQQEDYSSDQFDGAEYEGLGVSEDRYNILRQQFMELQVEYGLSEKQAAMHVQALMAASGEALSTQMVVVRKLKSVYGEMTQANIGAWIQTQVDAFMDTDFDTDEWKNAGQDAVDAWLLGFNKDATTEQTRKMIAQITAAANREWVTGWESISQNEDMVRVLEEQGIDSMDALKKAIKDAGGIDEFMGDMAGVMDGFVDPRSFQALDALLRQAAANEKFVIDGVADSSSLLGSVLDSSINDVDDFSNHWAIKFSTLEFPDIQDEVKSMKHQLFDGPLDWLGDLALEASGVDLGTPIERMNRELAAMDPKQAQEFINMINSVALDQGIKRGKTAADTYFNIMNGIKASTNATTAATKTLGSAIQQAMAGFGRAKFMETYKTGMAQAQQYIADENAKLFDSQMEHALESRQNMWDNRIAAVNAANERASAAMDAKWEKKRDAAEAYWDRRTESVEKAIEAEEKAEEKRQKMFEAEIARIDALNAAANRNIDFNVALNEGNFDEAAKIRNDAGGEEAKTALDRAAEAGKGKSEKRVDTLEGNLKAIEKARDKAMKQLEKMEAAERRHLEKISQMRANAVQRDAEADMAAQQKIWDRRKKLNEDTIEAFLSFAGKNKKQVKQWAEDLGLEFDIFDKKTIDPMSIKWGGQFGAELHRGMENAAREMISDDMWTTLGNSMVTGLLKGMGFAGMKEFRTFVVTGKFAPKKDKKEDRHEGGVVGSGAGSRKGVARTQRGLHSSETMIRAQKGEYVVNRQAAANNLDTLDAINSGKAPAKHGTGGKLDGGGGGVNRGFGAMAAWPAAMVASGLAKGTGQAISSAYQKKRAEIARQRAAASARYGGSGGKNYNVGPVKPWVQEAANYLGSKHGISVIGGYRESATDPNGHPAGRALDFMTSSFAQGDALMKTIISMHGVLDAEYAIWKQRITGGSRSWGTWEGMEDRGSPTANHMDHVHLNFNASGKAGDLPSLGGSSSGGKGSGKYWRASVPGKGWNGNNHDYDNDYHSAVYAIAPGTVRSWTLPPSAGNGQHPEAYPRGYGSWGVVSELLTDYGDKLLYAHLWPGTTMNGRVAGGQKIAESASTGNSSGSHTHFEINGSENVKPWFEEHGIPLRKGGTVKFDNTPAMLHKGETVLTDRLTREFQNNVANGGGNTYNVNVDATGTDLDADEIAEKVVVKLKRMEQRKPGRRK